MIIVMWMKLRGLTGSSPASAWRTARPRASTHPIKLGYKNTKYLTKVVFLPKRNGGVLERSGVRVVRRYLSAR